MGTKNSHHSAIEATSPGTVFTEYVRNLSPEREPDGEHFAGLLISLRVLLVREIKRRGLWNLPPSFLGVYGGAHWKDDMALEELLLDCYVFVFVRRMHGLRRQASVHSDIGGLVVRSVRNFLHDTQKRHDPLGHRLFELLHQATGRLVESGCLVIAKGDPRLRNDTILVSPHSEALPLEMLPDPGPAVEAIIDELLPDLAGAWSRAEVVAQLAEHLAHLPADGIPAFCFGTFLDLMKKSVRQRWHAWHRDPDQETVRGENGLDISVSTPLDQEVIARQSFRRLSDCINDAIDRLTRSRKTRDYLRRLWLFLCSWATETKALEDKMPDGIPSDKRLGEVLGIPRNRIPQLKTMLGTQLNLCRAENEGDASISISGGLAERRAQARALTQQAAALEHQSTVAKSIGPPRPGDIYLLPETPNLEWVVLALDPSHEDAPEPPTGRILIVPLDDVPALGSQDVSLPGEDEITRLRCGHGIWIDRDALKPERRTGSISEAGVALGRTLYWKLDADSRRVSPFDSPLASVAASVDDMDPEYRIWMADLRAACSTLSERYNKAPEESRQARFLRFHSTLTLAASTLLALSIVYLMAQGRQIDELSRQREALQAPQVNLPVVFLNHEGPIRGPEDPLIITEETLRVALVLEIVSPEDYPAYRVVITHRNTHLFSSDQVQRSVAGTVSLELPTDLLESGEQLLEVYGLGKEEPELLERYVLTIQEVDRGSNIEPGR